MSQCNISRYGVATGGGVDDSTVEFTISTTSNYLTYDKCYANKIAPMTYFINILCTVKRKFFGNDSLTNIGSIDVTLPYCPDVDTPMLFTRVDGKPQISADCIIRGTTRQTASTPIQLQPSADLDVGYRFRISGVIHAAPMT